MADPEKNFDNYIRWSKYYQHSLGKDFEETYHSSMKFSTQLDKQYAREIRYEHTRGWVPHGDKPAVKHGRFCRFCVSLYFAVRRLFS